MHANDFVFCIGKLDDAPEVLALLASLGVTRKPKMPHDDIEARVDLPRQGLSLIFEPEDDPKSSRLVFTAVQFYSDADKHYTSFQGTLPGNLLFTDAQAEAHAKLGKPSRSKKIFRLDVWKFDGLELAVDYAKKDLRIGAITVCLPFKA